jgi:hypothetical protein
VKNRKYFVATGNFVPERADTVCQGTLQSANVLFVATYFFLLLLFSEIFAHKSNFSFSHSSDQFKLQQHKQKQNKIVRKLKMSADTFFFKNHHTNGQVGVEEQPRCQRHFSGRKARTGPLSNARRPPTSDCHQLSVQKC